MKKSGRILHLDASYLDVWHREGASLRSHTRFATCDAGYAAFRQYLDTCKNSLFYLLVDLIDEDFCQEALPHVRGHDRQALLNRKLVQFFPDTTFTLATSLGRNSEGRRDERFVFSALTRPQALHPWLQVMDEAGVALVGAYVPSQLTADLKSNQPSGCRIVVTLGKGGLRQSCYIKGDLLFSRLLTGNAESLTEAAPVIVSEAEKIRQYLIGQRLMQRDASIQIACLTTATDFSQLKAGLNASTVNHFSCEHLQTQAHAEDCLRIGDAALAHQLATHPPRKQYLPANLRQHYRVRQLGAALRMASLVSIIVSVALSTAALIAASNDQTRYAQAQATEQAARLQYQSTLATLPDTHETSENLRALATASATFKRQSPRIDAMLLEISSVLDDLPDVTLHKLHWTLSDNPPAAVIAELEVRSPNAEVSARFVEQLAALPTVQVSTLSPSPDSVNSAHPLAVRLVHTLPP